MIHIPFTDRRGSAIPYNLRSATQRCVPETSIAICHQIIVHTRVARPPSYSPKNAPNRARVVSRRETLSEFKPRLRHESTNALSVSEGQKKGQRTREIRCPSLLERYSLAGLACMAALSFSMSSFESSGRSMVKVSLFSVPVNRNGVW